MYNPHKSPSVCVGISVYRQPLHWLTEAIESVQRQSWRHWCLRIRLDGHDALLPAEQDSLVSLVAGDSRISLIIGRRRFGCFGSYRCLFRYCPSEFLLQLDADDRLVPDALSQSVDLLSRRPSSPWLYSQAMQISPEGKPLGLDPRALRPWCRDEDLVHFSTFHLRVVRTAAYRAVGGYSARYSHAGDYDLSLKLAELGEPCHLPHPLYEYRLHESSSSQSQRRLTHTEAVQAAREALQRRGLTNRFWLIQHPVQEIVTLEEIQTGPIVVAGMHRSGTSLLARALMALGIDLGGSFPAADGDNPQGYQEDGGFLALHRSWFQQALDPAAGGWTDWGWTPKRSVSCLGDATWRAAARAHIQRQRKACWGWKDPRTTLVLPFWQRLIGSIKVIGLFRAPWDLSDALCRLDLSLFRRNPFMILPLWQLYNQRLLEFCQANPEHMVLIQAEAFAQEPQRLPSLLDERWSLKCQQSSDTVLLAALVDPARLRSLELPDPLVSLYRIVHPELVQIWCELIARADLSQVDASISPPLLRWSAPTNPQLTVVIPTHNPCHWLLESIASVVRYQPKPGAVEVLIVDDGSYLPESLELLQRLETHGFVVIHQAHCGLAAARNTGFRAAAAEFVLPLDDDNRLLAPYFTKAINLLHRHPSIGMVYGDRVDFGAVHQRYRPGPLRRDQLLQSNTVDACAVFRRSLWLECGGYDENLTAFEDWDLWLTAVRQGLQCCYLPEPCFEYRVREHSMLHRHLADAEEHSEIMSYLRRKHGGLVGRKII